MPLSPTDIRNSILLSIVALTAGVLVPMIPYVGMPIAAFALAWFAYRFGLGESAALAIAASLPMIVTAPVLGLSRIDTLFVTVALLAVGPGAVWALERYPAYSVVTAIALVTAAAFLLLPMGSKTLAGSVELYSTTFRNMLRAQGADAAAIRTALDAFAAQMRLGWPYSSAYTMGLGALFSVPVVVRAGRLSGRAVRGYPPLAETDLSFHLVWPTIGGLALLAAGMTWGGKAGIVYAVGYNVSMLVRPALFLQGLGVFAMLYRRVNAGKVWRVVGFVLLGLTEFVMPSVSLLGAVDLFANVRKLPRGTLDQAR